MLDTPPLFGKGFIVVLVLVCIVAALLGNGFEQMTDALFGQVEAKMMGFDLADAIRKN